MKERIISFILLTAIIIPIFIDSSNTLANERNISNSNSDGIATVTKSAKWINEGKTEAEITIEVKTNKIDDNVEEDIKNGDIIFILDRSGSMGNAVNLDRETIERDVMKTAATTFLKGSYANNGNRVAYGEFSSALWLFSTTNGGYGRSGSVKYVFGYDKILKSVNDITTANQARDELLKTLKKYPETLKFYSNTSDIETQINRAIGEWLYGNTDLNLPFIWARCMLESRPQEEQIRKPYIIIITDGQPYPENNDRSRKQQASQTSYDWRKGQYVANKFAVETASILRNNYNAEIYTIILDTSNADYGMWNSMVGDNGASASNNTAHIYSIGRTASTSTAKATMNDILERIYADMKSRASSQETAILNASLTDIINTELFSVSQSKNAITTNIGEATLSDNGKTVTWHFSGIDYGSKCTDGKWPTLKIKINLKDPSIYGDDMNTNSIIGGDDKCALVHSKGEEIKVQTPWLSRPKTESSVTIKYIDNDTGKILYNIALDNLQNQSLFPSKGTIKSKYALSGKQLQLVSGIEKYELLEDKIIIDNKKYSLQTLPEKISINSNSTIEFYYTKARAKVYIRTFIVNKLDNVITGIINNSERSMFVEVGELQENAAPLTDKYEYLGYVFSKNENRIINSQTLNNLDKDENVVEYVLENSETAYIDFYYLNQEYTYDATVNYIDNDTGEILYSTNVPQIKNYSVFPSYGTLSSRYLIKDLKGTIGISEYDLITDKIIINGEQYTTSSVPQTLVMDEDKTIEFYYRKQNKDATIRTYIVTKVDDKIIGIRNNSSLSHLAYSDIEYQKEAPVLPNYQYLGYIVRYDDESIIASYTLNSLNANQTVAKYKLSNYNQKIYVNFIYLEQFNTVTVKYQDERGNKILDDVVETVKSGGVVYPDVPNTIKNNNIVYNYTGRSDGKNQNSSIGPINKKTVVIITYKSIMQNPVVSYPVINSQYIQNGHSAVILGQKITVSIPSKGKHPQMSELGVTEPTNGWNSIYAKSEYLKFNCDVIYENKIIKAGELISIARNENGGIENKTVDILIPEYVEEGTYKATAIVSNLAINKKTTSKHKGYNNLYEENEAAGEIEFVVKGKIYDFTITNIIGDNFWPTSSFKNINGYKADIDETNKIAMLPIGQRNYQNSSYKYGISLGSSFFYNLNTIGLKNEKIIIETNLIYLDKNGEQIDVDIYYKDSSGQYKLLPYESTSELITKLNIDAYKPRTNITKELQQGLSLYTGVEYNKNTTIGNHKQIQINNNLKTPFVNYFSEEQSLTKEAVLNANIGSEVLKATSHWYGYYSLPYSTIVVPKGTSQNLLSREIKTGYIVVLFKIKSIDKNGEEYLVYDNQLVGNEWKNEGGVGNEGYLTVYLPNTSSSANKDAIIKVENGYYPIAIYGAGTRLSYDVGGTH